uniref:OSJNBa0056L23.13 protein n=1 Tax=Oryza sativa subsp. japonica TaxID=39947 RepID=Q7XL44_ORYSJ|nr:OSJNBa0056L23.13 [Oryza sativa Japonica Group]
MRMERPARATVFRRNRGAAGGEDNAATSIGVPATYRSRPEAGRRGGGDAGDEGGVAEPREVVATSAGARETRQWRPEVEQWRQRHCFAGEDASPVLSPRNGGLTEGEEVAARPREKTARPDGAPARRERRLEAAGAEEREGRRRERASGGHRAKRRAGRGGGGGGDAGGGDGATGRRTVEAAQAAGGGRRRGRERRAAGRGLGTTGRLGMGLKR